MRLDLRPELLLDDPGRLAEIDAAGKTRPQHLDDLAHVPEARGAGFGDGVGDGGGDFLLVQRLGQEVAG